jgi:hypothetical protein
MKLFLVGLLYMQQFFANAQNTQPVVLRLPITDYIVESNDSISIVQIALPRFSTIEIKEKTLGVIHKNFATGKDNLDSIIGVGRCNLIKDNYYYFGIKLRSAIKPEAGDILTFSATLPICYNGLLFDMSRNSIAFQTIEEKEFYNIETPFLLTKAEDEDAYFKHMVKDIQYTGTAMLKQMPDSNKPVEEGMFKGKKLFNVMQETTVADVKEFLKYVQARPKKYAAHTWKISEVYATWVDAGSPQVQEK